MNPSEENIFKDSSDSKLLAACIEGNASAVSEFYNRYEKLIYSAIHSWLNKNARGEDRTEYVKEVFHEAFIELMDNNFLKLRNANDPDSLSGLIFTIAYYKTSSYFKKIARTRNIIQRRLRSPEDPMDDPVIRKELNDIVKSFLEELDERESRIFKLKFQDGMEYHEIADLMNLTTNHVGVLISRIKEKFIEFAKRRGIESVDFIL